MSSHSSKSSHSFPIRVYYEDSDAAGIVYYANYLKFAERARTEALRSAGIDQTDLMRNEKIGFVVRRCVADFLKPAKLDDLLTVETRLLEMNRASLHMRQGILRGKETLVTLDIKLAVVGPGMKPVRLPEPVRHAMLKIFNG